MVDALAKMTKELSCLTVESISLKVQNRHLLVPIEIKLIELKALEEKVITLDEVPKMTGGLLS